MEYLVQMIIADSGRSATPAEATISRGWRGQDSHPFAEVRSSSASRQRNSQTVRIRKGVMGQSVSASALMRARVPSS